MSPAKAVLIGHLLINGPALIIVAASVFGAIAYEFNWRVGVAVGFVVAWLWWSLMIPKWRRWAHAQGVDAAQLQRLGERTLLVWPKGWIFEKTELRNHNDKE